MEIENFATMLIDLANNSGRVLEDLSDGELQRLLVYSNKLYYAVSKEIGDRQQERSEEA